MSSGKNGSTHRWALAGILLVALGLRVWGIGFGLPHATARPDETSVAGPAVKFLSGNFEPPHFMYPTGFMYGLSGAYLVYYEATRPWAAYKTLHDFAESRRQDLAPFLLTSRAISVLFGVLTVFWLYGLATRAAGRAAALLAAAFLAVCFLHVRDSHFGVTDATMTGLVVLAVSIIAKWHEVGTLSLAARAGLAGGLAMAMKYNGLGVAVPFGVAAVDRWIAAGRSRAATASTLTSGVLFAAIFAVVFLASSFYILIQPDRFWRDVTLQGQTFAAGHGIVMPIGWSYHATVTLPAALGWPMFIAGVAGLGWFLARDLRRALVIVAFPVAYYVVAGSGHTVFARYTLPLLPFLCLGAAYTCVRVAETLTVGRGDPRRVAATALLGVLVALPTAAKSVQIDRLLSRTDNRVLVANALRAIVAPGATIYQTGSAFGKIQWPEPLRLHDVEFNDATGAFDGPPPEWIVIQHSPLAPYSAVPVQLPALLSQQYKLVKTFPVGDDRVRTYDPQDAFFLPLAGLDGIERPGPTFDLYQRNGML